jgi:hypothetical protein
MRTMNLDDLLQNNEDIEQFHRVINETLELWDEVELKNGANKESSDSPKISYTNFKIV